MAQVYRIDGVEIENRVRTTADPSGVEGLPSSASYGEAMIAGVTIEDLEGELDLMGWHTFTHDETDCTGAERTFTGWITGKNISRGAGRQAVGAARIWECEIIDQNAVWKLKLFRAASAQRPAETDIERMDFMRSSAPMAATPVADNGRWNVTDNPVAFGASSYVAQYPIDLANSVAGTSGKNFYAYWDDAAGEISGHYDLVGANPLSTIAISNVIADKDSTTVYPFIDAVLTRSPEDQVNGVLFQYLGNQYVYVQDVDLFGPGEFSPDNFDRDVLYSTDRVGKLETANALAASQLAARSTEKDTLTVTVELPPSQVNLLHAGMRVAARFSHLPGYEGSGGVELAVIRRDVIPPRVVGGMYTVRLELSNMVAPTSAGGGDPGGFPPAPDVCDPDDIAIDSGQTITDDFVTGNVTLASAPTGGRLQLAFVGLQDPFPANSSTPGGFTDVTGVIDVAPAHQDFRAQAWMRIAQAGDTTTLETGATGTSGKRMGYVEFDGVDTLHSFDIEEFQTAGNVTGSVNLGTVTPPSGEPCLLVFGMVPALNVNDGFSAVKGHADDVEDIDYGVAAGQAPYMWLGHRIIASASGSYTPSITVSHGGAMRGYGTFVAVFLCSGTDPDTPCLSPAQPSPEDEAVTPATGDGTTVTFSTRCPFADESLHVKVDNLNQDAAVTSYDGAAGTFTLGYAPVAGEVVTVNYLGR